MHVSDLPLVCCHAEVLTVLPACPGGERAAAVFSHA